MKRIITLLLLCLFIYVESYAQDHIAFKNIPIDGSLAEFIDKLKADGFTVLDTDNDGTWLRGKFTGQECNILVKSSSVSHTVYSVYALFTVRREWSMAKSDYNSLKAALTKKYGNPISKEEFTSYGREGNSHEFVDMRNGYVIWHSDYKTEQGVISLYIKDQEYGTGCAIINYEDKANLEKATEELTSDL